MIHELFVLMDNNPMGTFVLILCFLILARQVAIAFINRNKPECNCERDCECDCDDEDDLDHCEEEDDEWEDDTPDSSGKVKPCPENKS